MSRCLLCGNEAAYDSFQWQWCPSEDCTNFRDEMVIKRPVAAYQHDYEKDIFLGNYQDSFWGLLDLYLSFDLLCIKIRWSSQAYSVASEFIDGIKNSTMNNSSMDDAFIEGYKLAQKLFGV